MTTTNPNCPDHSSHEDNVAEQMGIFTGVIPAERIEEFEALVEAEYRACEGH